MANELKNEQSPYLKQHENNPVNWFPWNKETLKKAKDQQKPIFLSVGYASCHWCHVMAHESFEDEATAKLMNEKFINIKVDREERPDLDYVFQKSLSILTGTQGGWPLSMFLDENAVPFTGGTYFPPHEMHGRPDFKKVLNNVSDVYKENREKIIAQAPQMQSIFLSINQKSAVLNQPLEPFLDKIISYLDEKNGSFKGAPKFPQFYLFDTMFYYYLKTNDKKYFTPVEILLKNISSKGIYDQLAGGIARYTVDENWIIPHFEKMLYDNTQFIGNIVRMHLHQSSPKTFDWNVAPWGGFTFQTEFYESFEENDLRKGMFIVGQQYTSKAGPVWNNTTGFGYASPSDEYKLSECFEDYDNYASDGFEERY